MSFGFSKNTRRYLSLLLIPAVIACGTPVQTNFDAEEEAAAHGRGGRSRRVTGPTLYGAPFDPASCRVEDPRAVYAVGTPWQTVDVIPAWLDALDAEPTAPATSRSNSSRRTSASTSRSTSNTSNSDQECDPNVPDGCVPISSNPGIPNDPTMPPQYDGATQVATSATLPDPASFDPGPQKVMVPAYLVEDGQPRTLITHSFPGQTVLVGNIGGYSTKTRAQPIAPVYGPIVDLNDAAYDAASFVPELDADADPLSIASVAMRPMIVIAATKVVLSGLVDVQDRGLVIIADQIVFEPGTTLRSQYGYHLPGLAIPNDKYDGAEDPAWQLWHSATFPASPYPSANPLRPGSVYLIGRDVRGLSGDLAVKLQATGFNVAFAAPTPALETLRPRVAVLSQGEATGFHFVSSFGSSAYPSCTAQTTPDGNGCLQNAEIEKVRITDTTFNRLLAHYAPGHQRRAYEAAESRYAQRNEGSAMRIYFSLLGTGTVYDRLATVRRDQIRAGLNYLGEDDRLLRRMDVAPQLDVLAGMAETLADTRDAYLSAITSGNEFVVTAAAIDDTIASINDEITLAEKQFEAAGIRMTYAETAIDVEGKKLDSQLGLYQDKIGTAHGEYQAFIDKANSGDCDPFDWVGLFEAIIKAIIDIVTLNWGDVWSATVDSFAAFADMADAGKKFFSAAKKTYDSFKDAWKKLEPAYKSVKVAYEKVDSYFTEVDELGNTLATATDQYASEFGVGKEHEGAHWDIDNPSSDECHFPSMPLPEPFDMELLALDIESTRGAVALAGIEYEEAKALVEAAMLKIRHAKAELDRAAALKALMVGMNDDLEAAMGEALPMAGLVDVRDGLCFRGKRIMDRMVRKSYEVARAISFLKLDVATTNADDNGTIADVTAASSSPTSHLNMTFDYDWTKAGDALLTDLIGLGGAAQNLKDAWLAEHAQIESSDALIMELGQSQYGIEVSSLEDFKSAGYITVTVAPTSAYVAGGTAVRVHQIQVVLDGVTGVELHAEKLDSSIFRKGGDVVQLPVANIIDGVGDSSDEVGPATFNSISGAPQLGPMETIDDVNEPQFGLSLEGTWQIRLSLDHDQVDGEYQSILDAIEGGEIVFHTFGQS